MTHEQEAAFVFAQAAMHLTTVEAMKVANLEREHAGHAMAYDERAFIDELNSLSFTIRPYIDKWH